jgi:spore germination protein KC
VFPIEDLGFATLVAVDGRPGRATVYAQLVAPTALPGGTSGQGGEGTPVHTVVGHGPDVLTAVRDADQRSPKRIYFGQLEAVLVTDALASSGGLPMVLDYFFRNIKSRDIAWLYVARRVDLPRLLRLTNTLESYPARALVSQSQDALLNALTPPVRLYEVARILATPGWNPAIPLLTAEDGDYRVAGLAVFRRSRLAGVLTTAESAGYAWLSGTMGRTAVDIRCPRGGRAAFEVVDPSRRLEIVEAEGGKVGLRVSVEATLRLDHLASCPLSTLSGEEASLLLRRAAAKVRDDMATTLTAAQRLGTDVFGFGAHLAAHRPAAWAKLARDWDTQGFAQLPVWLQVTFTLDSTGLLGPSVPND